MTCGVGEPEGSLEIGATRRSMTGGGFDWDLDLTPARLSSATDDSEPDAASGDAASVPLDIAAALVDLKRAIDRLSMRMRRIERALVAEPGMSDDEVGLTESEAGSAPSDGLAGIATRQLRTLRPRPVPGTNPKADDQSIPPRAADGI
jgi:hypothetical protein